jgi:hypothetical protein
VNLLTLFDAVADTAFIGLMNGVAHALGDRPAPEPVYALGETVEQVLTQLCPDTPWEEGTPFFYDPGTKEIGVPDLAATDLESRVKAVHEAFHARRHERGERAYTELPIDQPLEAWTVGQLWHLFREEQATNREARAWLGARLSCGGRAAALGITQRINTRYFHCWARRFFTLRWRGVEGAPARPAATMGASPDRYDYLEVEGGKAPPAATEDSGGTADTGWGEMLRWVARGTVLGAFFVPLVTYGRLALLGLTHLKLFVILMGLIGMFGSVMGAFYLCCLLK